MTLSVSRFFSFQIETIRTHWDGIPQNQKRIVLLGLAALAFFVTTALLVYKAFHARKITPLLPGTEKTKAALEKTLQADEKEIVKSTPSPDVFTVEGEMNVDKLIKGKVLQNNVVICDGEFGEEGLSKENFSNPIQYLSKGEITLQNGDKFQGRFKDGICIRGTGTLHHLFKMNEFSGVYKGDIKRNQPDGQGEIIFSNGFKATGQFIKGEFANGTLNTNQGYSQGNFKNFILNGVNGKKVEGLKIFKGKFLNGLLHGEGEIREMNNEHIISGRFEKGELVEGTGTFTFPDGRFYYGEIANRKPSGQGEIFHPNGDYAEGVFDENGQLNGEGRLAFKNAEKPALEGIFNNGSLEKTGMYLTKKIARKKDNRKRIT